MEGPAKSYIVKFKGDIYLLAMTIILIGLGMLVVYSSVSARAVMNTASSTERIFFGHIVMLLLGIAAMAVSYKIGYKWFGLLSWPMLIISMILMVLVTIPGIGKEINDASRWLVVPVLNIQFQPSDLAKIAVIIHMAASLSKLQSHIGDFSQILLKSVGVPLIVVLLIAMNDMSTALLLTLIIAVIMFVGRVQSRVFLSFMGVLVAASPIVYYLSKRVRTAISRIMDYFNAGDGLGETDLPYQVEQSNIALALGGFNGVGAGHSQQRYFLPEAFSDFIYAIIIEEHGLKIGVFILFIYMSVLFRGMKITQKTQNAFSGLLVMGLSLLVVFQAVIHMAVVVGLFPVTGLTLPWISMGGTSILFTGVAFGIILNVSKETNLA